MGRIRTLIVRHLLRDSLANLEREIEEEFLFHIEMKAASLEANGMDPEVARAMAEECFGDSRALLRAGIRDLSGARRTERRKVRMEWLGQDLRDGLRRLIRHPGYSLIAAGTLALGLSTSTAVFTYVNAYSRPFPGADVDGVYQVFQSSEAAPYGPVSYPDFQDLQAAAGDRYEITASGLPQFGASVRHESMAEVIFGQGVSGNFFSVLKVQMTTGRGLSPEDDQPGAPPALVLAHEYWVRRYGSDPDVLGKTILLNNEPYTIVGVAAPSFLGPTSAFRPQIWMPFEHMKRVYWARSENETNREAGVILPYVKPREGASRASLNGVLAGLATTLDEAAPLEDRSRRFLTEPATWIAPAVRQAESPTTRIMLIAAAALLLLACANMANLVLSAGARRGQEMALRAAMGASRGMLLRQLLAENLILSFLSGGLALLVAGPTASRLSSYFARPSVWGVNVPREIGLDPRVMAFALVAAVATGILTGFIPALRVSNWDLASDLKTGGRWSSDDAPGRRLGMRDLLVSTQVALSVVLLFVSGLVLRTLESATKLDPGFNAETTLASYMTTSSMGLPIAERHTFYRMLAERFEEFPWVQAATYAEQAPLSGHPIQGLRAEGVEELITTTISRVLPGYLDDMEMTLLRGRSFLPTDTAGAPGVVIVNETLAERLAQDGSALGATLWIPADLTGEERGFEVVGVVKNAREISLLEEPGPVAYFSYPQHYASPGNAFLLKVAGNPSAAVSLMEEELHKVDPRIAVVNIIPYSEVVGGFLYPQRMNAELFTIIAMLGLILSAAGVFGVVSLAVAQRRREIGIRLAIGAGGGEIVRVAVSRVVMALLLGLGVGLAGALVATRLVGSLVWGISPTDPTALLLGVGVLLGVVTLAVSIPVRRALSIDPATTLQAE